MTLTLPRGFRAAGISCGLKKDGSPDLGLLLADDAWPAHALFTRNALVGAHVPVCRDHLAHSGGLVRAVLVNAKVANCATGEQGIADNRHLCAALAERIGCPPEHVLVLSTGVIGERLPVPRIEAALDPVIAAASPEGAADFARAITTTDTHPKAAATPGIVGFAKGSGMIHPDMATLFAFLLTEHTLRDAPGQVARDLADRSFHRISVDGDTSPNDTFLLWTSALARTPAAPSDLEAVAVDLARQVAADGEGATRLVTVQVRGAAGEADAAHVGRLLATSPLTKTAVAGRDPNWGRILSTAGRAGVALDPAHARVWIGPAVLFEEGRPWPEREAEAHRHLEGEQEVVLGVDLGVGEGAADVWTCDLTADYVRINADYRT